MKNIWSIDSNICSDWQVNNIILIRLASWWILFRVLPLAVNERERVSEFFWGLSRDSTMKNRTVSWEIEHSPSWRASPPPVPFGMCAHLMFTHFPARSFSLFIPPEAKLAVAVRLTFGTTHVPVPGYIHSRHSIISRNNNEKSDSFWH